jgi:undecaprenyl-diphosphatase
MSAMSDAQMRKGAAEVVKEPPAHYPGSFLARLRGRPIVPAVAVLTIVFFALTFLILRADLQPTEFDKVITHEIQELPSMPVGEVLIAVSWPGFQPQNWLLTIAILLFMAAMRWITEAVFTGISAAGGLLAELVKNLVDRPRPTPDLARITTELHTFSFPSGHVTGYVVLFGFLFYLAYALLPRPSILRALALLVTGVPVLLVGASRVYMGQHWASDTLAGYALGFAYLLIVIELYRVWQARHPVPKTSDEEVAASG